MAKNLHEIRDPIHVFIRFDSSERAVINSCPFQRLRNIHQLCLTYLVYPGATHRRFEHSLGVMELASRVYDVITEPDNIFHESVKSVVPNNKTDYQYWRRVLRMAALCHDLGHLPFSHGSEDLLPPDWDHELITVKIILDNELQSIWKELNIRPEDVAKIAVGPKKYKNETFTDWEAILSEIIVGNAFGVDRMDYLLRDSHHAGVAYGKFDHYRLIDTLRILPKSEEESLEPVLGIEEGGIHSAESLLLARYFMFTQLYCHPVRRIYDLHLQDFLKEWLPDGLFPIKVEKHLQITDNEIIVSMYEALRDNSPKLFELAQRIVNREHYRCIYQRNPDDIKINPDSAVVVYNEACKKFDAGNIRFDTYKQKGGVTDFPVLTMDKRIASSLAISHVLTHLPVIATDYVYVSLDYRKEAEEWLQKNRKDLIQPKGEEQ